jgi:hypothetical protein
MTPAILDACSVSQVIVEKCPHSPQQHRYPVWQECGLAEHLWLTPVILATQEAEIRKILA